MPAKSQAQRAWMAVNKGKAWMKRHGYDNKGPLPKRVTPKKVRKKRKP